MTQEEQRQLTIRENEVIRLHRVIQEIRDMTAQPARFRTLSALDEHVRKVHCLAEKALRCEA